MADSTRDPVTTVAADSPRLPDRPARRTFSDREKLRILEAADRCSQPGELGLLLRREGLYSSHLTSWRRWRRRRFPQHPQSGTPPTAADLLPRAQPTRAREGSPGFTGFTATHRFRPRHGRRRVGGLDLRTISTVALSDIMHYQCVINAS